MIYSVWIPSRNLYDYYEVPSSAKDVLPPSPSIQNDSSIGLAPETAAWKLPLGARKVGSGSKARGMIASNGSPLAGLAGLGDLGSPMWMALFLVGGGYLVWKWLGKHA